jgi:hemoglobin-like flavoprotein
MNKGKNLVDLKAVAALIEDTNFESPDNVHPINPSQQNSPDSVANKFKPDEELIQSTTRIRNQRDLVKQRLNKMESHREKVKDSVYQKVLRDYTLQLETINQLLNEKKILLKKELKNLYLAYERINIEITRHQEILEEARFRHYLEEFSEEQYKEVEEFEAKEIQKLQSDLSTLQSFMKVHEELFDPEDLGRKAKVDHGTEDTSSQNQVIEAKDEEPVTKTMYQPAEEVAKPEVKKEEVVQSKEAIQPNEIPSDDVPTRSIEKPTPEKSDITSADSTSENIEENKDTSNDSDEVEDILEDIEEDQGPSIDPSKLESSDNPDYFESPPEHTPEISFSSHVDASDQSSSGIKEDPIEEVEDHQEKSLEEDDQNTDAAIEGMLSEDILEEKVDEIQDQTSDDISVVEPSQTNDYAPQSSSSSSAKFKLVFIPGEMTSNLEQFELKDNISIGRSPSNDLVLRAPKMSRQHAAINKYKDEYILIDLKSSNGVFVNGKKIDEHTLEEGDELSIGGYKMIFEKN